MKEITCGDFIFNFDGEGYAANYHGERMLTSAQYKKAIDKLTRYTHKLLEELETYGDNEKRYVTQLEAAKISLKNYAGIQTKYIELLDKHALMAEKYVELKEQQLKLSQQFAQNIGEQVNQQYDYSDTIEDIKSILYWFNNISGQCKRLSDEDKNTVLALKGKYGK